ncbi:MAG TPA: hypothetical protein VFI84_01440 [Candidatus Saccharimonadales bacterium]|nr:hypothetical protein [Candidatus Saccharimonadales bacterium]
MSKLKHGKIITMSEKNKEVSNALAAPQDDGETIAVRIVKTEQPLPVAPGPEALKTVEPEFAAAEVPTETVESTKEEEQMLPPQKRTKARKTARNVAISAFVMLVLLAGGGVAYTYFFGPRAAETAATPKVEAAAQPLPAPAKPADNAPEGVAIGSFTTPVKPGDNASIQVHTQPTSTCTIVVTYNSVAATDSGLVDKTADDYGTAGWSWTVPATTPEGKWPVKVTCTYHGRSGVYQAELEVSKAA